MLNDFTRGAALTVLMGLGGWFVTVANAADKTENAVDTHEQIKLEYALELANASGCFVCHAVAPDPNVPVPLAPAYTDIAAHYQGQQDVFDELLDRVQHGTVYKDQVWEGKVSMRFMPPNVNVERDDAAALVHWILDLAAKPSASVTKLDDHDRMLALASTSGCMSCHLMAPSNDPRLVPLAPSFREVAALYEDDDSTAAKAHLVDAVTNGTINKTKVWENVNMRFMPGSVALSNDDAAKLVDWILGLEHGHIRLSNSGINKPKL